MTPPLTAFCPVCKGAFRPKNTLHRYCSKACALKVERRKERERAREKREVNRGVLPVPVRLLCPVCKTAFMQTDYHQKYCSRDCYTAAQKKIVRKYCIDCGNQFGTTLTERTRCTRCELQEEAKRKRLQAAQEALVAAIYAQPEDDPEPDFLIQRTVMVRHEHGSVTGLCSSKRCAEGCRLGRGSECGGAVDYREEWSRP